MFRQVSFLTIILTEREVQCSLTAETRANGDVNSLTISIRSSCRISGGEHFLRRRMQSCTDLTRPWMEETSLMPLLTSLEGWVKCKVKDKCKDKDIRVSLAKSYSYYDLMAWSNLVNMKLQKNNTELLVKSKGLPPRQSIFLTNATELESKPNI